MGMLNRILVEFDYLSGTAVHLVRILCIHTFRGVVCNNHVLGFES